MWIADLCRAGMDSRETDGVYKFFFTCASCEADHSSSNIVFKLLQKNDVFFESDQLLFVACDRREKKMPA